MCRTYSQVDESALKSKQERFVRRQAVSSQEADPTALSPVVSRDVATCL